MVHAFPVWSRWRFRICWLFGASAFALASLAVYRSAPAYLSALSISADTRKASRSCVWPGDALHVDRREVFRSYISQFNPGPTTRRHFAFLTLEDVMKQIAKQQELSNYVCTVGGQDFATTWLAAKGRHGLHFNIAEEPGLEHLKFVGGIASPQRLIKGLRADKAPVDFDVLKLDMDSWECDFVEQILKAGYRPRVIVVETNPAWPPPLKYRLSWKDALEGQDVYSGNHSDAICGCQSLHCLAKSCSLQAVYDIALPFGYDLLQYPMEDAWLVHKKYWSLFPGAFLEPILAYRLGNPNYYIGELAQAVIKKCTSGSLFWLKVLDTFKLLLSNDCSQHALFSYTAAVNLSVAAGACEQYKTILECEGV